jgi:hypothetical protein
MMPHRTGRGDVEWLNLGVHGLDIETEDTQIGADVLWERSALEDRRATRSS